jgi:hypothetical protein
MAGALLVGLDLASREEVEALLGSAAGACPPSWRSWSGSSRGRRRGSGPGGC